MEFTQTDLIAQIQNYKNNTGFIPDIGKGGVVSGKLTKIFDPSGDFFTIRKLEFPDIIFGEGVSVEFSFDQFDLDPTDYEAIKISFEYKTDEFFSDSLFTLWSLEGDLPIRNKIFDFVKTDEFTYFEKTVFVKNLNKFVFAFHLSSLNFLQRDLIIKDLKIEVIDTIPFNFVFPEGIKRDIEIEYRKRIDPNYPNKVNMENNSDVVEYWSKNLQLASKTIDSFYDISESMVDIFYLSYNPDLTNPEVSGDYTVGFYNLLDSINATKNYLANSIVGKTFLSIEEIENNDDFVIKDEPLIVDDFEAELTVEDDLRNPNGNNNIDPYIEKLVNRLVDKFSATFTARQTSAGGAIVEFNWFSRNYEVIGVINE